MINTTIPNTTLIKGNSKMKIDAYGALHSKEKFNKKALEELLGIWMEATWELDEDEFGRPYVANLADIKNMQYYTRYYAPFMQLMREETTFSAKTTISQTKYPEWSSFAPLPLKAALLGQGISYDVWRHPNTLRQVLRNFMWSNVSNWLWEKMVEENSKDSAHEWDKNIKVNRFSDALYEELFKGKQITGYTLRFAKPHINILEEEYGEVKEDSREYLRELPTPFKHMYLQSWIFHPTIRNEKFMILWPWKWDYIPPPHSYHPPSTLKQQKTVTITEEWDL